MTFLFKFFLLLASLSFSPSIADARVHRRNVGPVILDLGALPSGQDTTSESQSPVEAGNGASPPKDNAPPETGAAPSDPVSIPATYPSHSQPLGALLVTMYSPDIPEEKSASSILLAGPEAHGPALIAYYHPTLADDDAMLNPPVVSPPTPVATTEPQTADAVPASEADLKIVAGSASPVDHLRSLVVWVWRLLFFIGFGALAVTLLRRRQARQPMPSTPTGDAPEPEFSPKLIRSGALQETATSLETVTDSLSMRTQKSDAFGKPEAGSRAYGLIEPGAVRSSKARAGAIRDQDPKGQQALL